jgi:hypothetical protein
MDRRCSVCRKRGAMASGRCLRCGAAEAIEHLKRGFTTPTPTKGAPMPKRKTDHAAEDAQPPLVPMSKDETHDAGRDLANLIRELEATEDGHAASRKEQAAEREMLRNRIAAIASTIRSAGR